LGTATAPCWRNFNDASFDLGTTANRRAVWQWNFLRYLPVE
jgi:hypothetical protein